MLYQEVKKRKAFLEEEIKRQSRELANYPPGEIVCVQNGKYVRNMLVQDGQYSYIPKKDFPTAKSLAKKKFLSAALADLETELNAADAFLKYYKSGTSMTETLMKSPAYRKMISLSFTPVSEELAKWVNEPYEKNPYHPEALLHSCLSGHMVRSKSESMIDQALFLHRIPFRYECKLSLKETTYYPDFTIRHPQTGQTFYWEHFGLMDSPAYVTKTFQKLQTYSLSGFIPSINLITTYESKEHPLTFNTIEAIILHYFL